MIIKFPKNNLYICLKDLLVVRFGAGKKEVWILNTGACRLAISNEINPFCHTYILQGGGRGGDQLSEQSWT